MSISNFGGQRRDAPLIAVTRWRQSKNDLLSLEGKVGIVTGGNGGTPNGSGPISEEG